MEKKTDLTEAQASAGVSAFVGFECHVTLADRDTDLRPSSTPYSDSPYYVLYGKVMAADGAGVTLIDNEAGALIYVPMSQVLYMEGPCISDEDGGEDLEAVTQ